MAKQKLRPLGDITQDLESLLQEMAEGHKMQIHEIIGVIYLYLQSHTNAEEQYDDGTRPVLYYGHYSERSKEVT